MFGKFSLKIFHLSEQVQSVQSDAIYIYYLFVLKRDCFHTFKPSGLFRLLDYHLRFENRR